MAAEVQTITYLSSYLSISEPSLITLTTTPTIELVQSVLEAVVAKSKELDEVKADKLRLEVELESAVHTGESRVWGLKATVEKSLKETTELRTKIQELETTRSGLESELQTFRSSTSTSTSELESLKSRIISLESSNRDTVSLLESKSTSHDRLAEELSTQHQKTIDLRREISGLEQSIQAATSASTTAKFRESNLQQEVELVKRSNEWFETELQTKAAELSKIRKEKGAKISELQRRTEDATSTIDSLRRTESTLRSRLEEVSRKADEAFAKVQRMQENATKEEESFRKELESAQRLAELFEGSMNTARERLQEVQAAFDQSKDDAAEEIGRIRAQAETDRAERDASDRRVMELEVQIERLEADLVTLQQAASTPSMPSTPRRGINGTASGTPAGARMKGALNFTQMYSEYTAAKNELDVERRRNEKLSATIDDMIRDLESKQPQMEELRTEHERLEAEVIEMTALLEDIGGERDKAKKQARKWEGQVEGLRREGELLRQQLRDLSAQIKILLSEVHARETGEPELDPLGQSQLEQAARDQLDEATLQGLTATGQLISRRLLTFKNIKELQEQNVNLLRTVRELGDDLEGAEARKNEDQRVQDRTELESLRVKVEKYKDEMKAMVNKSSSYIKERDMFRRMLQHRGQLAPGADLASLFGQSMDSMPPMTPSGRDSSAFDGSQSAKEAADLGRIIREMQQHFDAYREEASTDHRALKEQSERLSREKNDLHAEVSRTSSQLTLARERHEMLQANYQMLQNENLEQQKRVHSLSESAAKQDLRTQQIAEELIEAKALMDSMRNEAANLKAEKEMWKRIEKRLSEDNENLMNERSRLNGLITSMQSLQNERELSDSDTRRKLQSQLECVEGELQTIKRKLEQEVEDGKRAALRREYEKEQSQKSIDDLRSGLGVVREELVATKTTKDHLQARVDELTVELKSAEERVRVLQPRLTARSKAPAASTEGTEPSAQGADEISHEQELAIEVSELRRDLDLAKRELDSARNEVEQYKAISQASEEELQAMNDTREEYRESIERDLELRDSRIRTLEQTVQDLTTEMTSLNAELSTLRVEHSQKARESAEGKTRLEAEIVRLRDEDERHATAAHFHQEDLKAQAEIAQQAQQSYENELVKHAQAAQALQRTRAEYNLLRTEVVELRTEAEAAKMALTQNEGSWEEMKERYERELRELRVNGQNVNAQNKLLHQQLESVGKQIASLQQHRTEVAAGGDSEAPIGTPRPMDQSSVDELRELVRYLREGKDIVDVQLDLSIREGKRLKQQLDYAQSQLDDTRLKLDQERRHQADQSRSAMTHKELLEKITELNLYRESTVTLRNEARQAQAALAESSKKVEELLDQIEPLKATIMQLENAKETTAGEMKLLQEDRDRYQQRNQTILQKYDRVDPAEMESLKEQITALQTQCAELSAEKGARILIQEQVDSFPEQLRKAQEEVAAQWNEGREKLKNQFKERSRVLVQIKNEKADECQALVVEKAKLETRIVDLEQQLQATRAEKEQNVAAASSNSSHPTGIPAPAETPVNSGNRDAELEALRTRTEAAESSADAARGKAQTLQETINAQQGRIMELESQITQLSETLNTTNAQLEQARSTTQQAHESQNTDPNAQVEQLQQSLSEAQYEVESLKTNAAISEMIFSSGADADVDTKTVTERVDEIKTEIETRLTERVRVAEEQYRRRADGMRAQLNKQIKATKDQITQQVRQEMEVESEEKIRVLVQAHQQEVEGLRAQHQTDLASLKEQEVALLEQAKTALAADGQPTNGDVPAAAEKSPVGMSGPVGAWKFTDAQARELLANNETLKNMLRGNYTAKVKKVREEQEQINTQRLQEANARAEKEKEQAIVMAEQRQKVKLSVAEGRARTLAVKVDIVQKAAMDTPDRAVVEVWEIAKAVRPATPGPLLAKPAQSSPGLAQSSPTVAQSGKGEMTPQKASSGQLAPVHGRPVQSAAPASSPVTGMARAMQPARVSEMGQQIFATSGAFGVASQPQPQPNVPVNPFAAQQALAVPQMNPFAQQMTPSQVPPSGPNDLATIPAQAQPSQRQQYSRPAPQQQTVGGGVGYGAPRNLVGGPGQSAIPRGGAVVGRGGRGGRGGPLSQMVAAGIAAPGGLPRSASGSSLPRGGGRGRGGPARGGVSQAPPSQQKVQNVQTGDLPPGQSGASPGSATGGRGGLNIGARQFVPGAGKRAREEGEVFESGSGGGKRSRGGGAV